MKKKLALRLIAAALAVAMVGSLTACDNSGETASTGGGASASDSGDSGDSGDGGEESKFAERVALDVVAFVGSGEADGLRSDPVSKYVEESLNIDLYLTALTEADWPTQLAALMAGGDLPDVFMLSDPTKQLPMLIQSNSALNLEPYLEEYASNTLNDPAGAMMVEAQRMAANSPDGNMYLWGMCKGSWDDGTVPTCGHYIR